MIWSIKRCFWCSRYSRPWRKIPNIFYWCWDLFWQLILIPDLEFILATLSNIWSTEQGLSVDPNILLLYQWAILQSGSSECCDCSKLDVYLEMIQMVMICVRFPHTSFSGRLSQSIIVIPEIVGWNSPQLSSWLEIY